MTLMVLGAGNEPIRITNNPKAKDPTFKQLLQFFRIDQTDKNRYILGKYVCAEFTRDVHDSAEFAGIRCSYVILDLEDSLSYRPEVGHALNVFRTKDEGLVYVDCTASADGAVKSSDYIVSASDGERLTLKTEIFGSSLMSVDLECDYFKSKEIVW